MFFVVDIPNSGQDVLEIMVNKPNRERQKLMREQNILKQVGYDIALAALVRVDLEPCVPLLHFIRDVFLCGADINSRNAVSVNSETVRAVVVSQLRMLTCCKCTMCETGPMQQKHDVKQILDEI